MTTQIGNNTRKKPPIVLRIFMWPFVRLYRRIFPSKLREWKCQECGRPFLEQPDRDPLERFSKGNVELFLYEVTGLARRKELKARIGVWHATHDGFYFGQLFSQDDIDALLDVVHEAVEFVVGYEEVGKNSTVVKMSSRRS